ncbi:hypothetical protein MSP8887_02516 [Marinomonas spartinae]|nr:hypothetical protein MSP8887_02516 [Marinomonas spartinae]
MTKPYARRSSSEWQQIIDDSLWHFIPLLCGPS